MCSFVTQPNAPDVSSLEGACNWHADCRNVHQNCFQIKCQFLYHKQPQTSFLGIWQYAQPASQLQRHRVGEWFVDVNVVNSVSHGGGGVMVWAGISYGQWTQLHFIDGNFNAQRYRDAILRPIVMPFIRRHHLMFQHDYLYTIPGSWKCPSSSMACILMAHFTHQACLGCYGSTWTTACSSSRQYPATSHAVEEKWDNIQQATINSLINWSRYAVLHEANGGHTRYWLVLWSTSLPLFF